MLRVRSMAAGLMLVLPVFAWSAAARGATLYVHAGLTSGDNNGTSWANAYRGRDGLARALTAATTGDSIWVAAGTYTPDLPVSAGGAGLRTASFVLRSGIAIFGGFSGLGNETSLEQRNVGVNVTILSGDLAENDAAYPSTTNWGENSLHVVAAGVSSPAGSTAILDGFTIRNGFANIANATLTDGDRGGGVIALNGATPTLRNLRIVNNRVTFGGGGLYLRGASPTLEDCRIESNNGGAFGGGCDMANASNPVWTRCSVIGNTAARAGGVEVFGTSLPLFTNCLFARNTATGTTGGGGLYVQSSTATLRLCTLVFNTVTSGPGSAVSGSLVTLSNCIVFGNSGATSFNQPPAAQYSLVPAGTTGTGNIFTTPLFVDAAANDFRPAAGSPVIDAGNNALFPPDVTVDLALRPRFTDDPSTADSGVGTAPIVDLGCYEFVPPCRADFNGAGGVTVQDVFDFLAAYFSTDPRADVNGSGSVTVQDVFDFLVLYFAGCP